MCLSVVVERGRGSTTTNALEAMKELPIYYRTRVGKKKLKLRHGFTILSRILAEALGEF